MDYISADFSADSCRFSVRQTDVNESPTYTSDSGCVGNKDVVTDEISSATVWLVSFCTFLQL